VALDVLEGTDATGIVTLGKHAHGSELELDDIGHLSGGNIDLDGVIDLGIRVGVTDGPAIVGNEDGDLLGGYVNLVHAAELVRGLLAVDAVEDEAALGVEKKTEAVSRLLEFKDIHETSRVVVVGADLAVDLDATLHADLLALLVVKSVLQAVAEDNADGKALTELVGTGGRAGSPNAGHLAEVPMPGGMEPLEVLLGTASPEIFSFSGRIRFVYEFNIRNTHSSVSFKVAQANKSFGSDNSTGPAKAPIRCKRSR